MSVRSQPDCRSQGRRPSRVNQPRVPHARTIRAGIVAVFWTPRRCLPRACTKRRSPRHSVPFAFESPPNGLARVSGCLDHRRRIEPLRFCEAGSGDLDKIASERPAHVCESAQCRSGEAIWRKCLGGGIDVLNQGLGRLPQQPDLFVRIIHLHR